LIGMSQDGLAAFEPAFADELAAIMGWAFRYMQAAGGDAAGPEDKRTWLRDETGGSVYLRLSTRPLEQPGRRPDGFAQDVIDGAYWWRPPSARTEVVIAYQGVVADAAFDAAGRLSDFARDVAVLAVTSADRLNAGWTAAELARRHRPATSHVDRLLADVPRHAAIVTVIDGHPATLAWLGGVHGHRTVSLGVEHFGQTGTVADLYRHFGIEADGITQAAKRSLPARTARVV
jgi:pyruvate dehydrogenase E1 component